MDSLQYNVKMNASDVTLVNQNQEDISAMDCICNLCECGNHSCQNFNSLQFENCEFSCDQSSKRHNFKRSCSQSSAKLNKESGTYLDSDTMIPKACQCLADNERYLNLSIRDPQNSTSSTPAQVSRQNNDSLHRDDQELMRILVTKPAVAGKPRDNIIFEGDMDLKTTFETSYEALARMRLDCWKKYQDSKYEYNKINQESNEAKLKQENIESVSVQNASSHCIEQMAGEDHNLDPLNSLKAQVTNDELCVNSNAGDPIEQKKDVQLKRETRQASGHIAKVRVDVPSRSEYVHDELDYHTKEKPSIARVEEYVDPDLAPIIVYDSNMNRLERVGIRKRSKYRPSTSLRPGARGFFGDQDEPTQSVSKGEHVESSQRGKRDLTSTVNDGTIDSGAMSPIQQSMSMRTAGKPTRKTSNSSDPRNIVNSKQRNYLTYTDQNLPIDSKRKILNNVNMTDHIKDHNIVAHSPQMDRVPEIPILGDGRISKETIDQDYSDENLRQLAELEEAAAVEEIQRATSDDHNGLLTLVKSNAQMSNSSQETSEVNQRKSFKSCQNQNFYIYDNEYPEARDRVRSNDPRKKRDIKGVYQSPDVDLAGNSTPWVSSRVYRNLFRESPDFIMTTGKFQENQTPRQESYSRGDCDDLTPETGDAQANQEYLKETLRKSRADCRVQKLQENFDYYESRSGHKYFIPKTPSPTR